MPKRISDIFQVDVSILLEENVFNGFIKMDSPFYLDPRLLRSSSSPRLQGSGDKVLAYFDDILGLMIDYISYGRDGDKKKAIDMLTFSELPVIGLGYSVGHKQGHGIGVILANNLFDIMLEFVKIGVRNPMIFEVAKLFEPGIGADRISDMISNILIDELVGFSQDVAKKLNLATSGAIVGNEFFKDLPCHQNMSSESGTILVPQDILTSLPLSEMWMNSTITSNKELRYYINDKIGKHLSNSPRWKDLKKSDLKSILLEKPELFETLFQDYEGKITGPYDFKRDTDNHFQWQNITREVAYSDLSSNPIDFSRCSKDILTDLLARFKHLVEREGLNQVFYKSSKDPEKERVGQLVLLEMCEIYLDKTHIVVNSPSGQQSITFKDEKSNSTRFILKYVHPSRKQKILKFYENLFSEYDRNPSQFIETVVILMKMPVHHQVMPEIEKLYRQVGSKSYPKIRQFEIDARIHGMTAAQRAAVLADF